ncbi:MAG: cytochrome c oxidase subunit I, partial [bacterium]|nr:cytochrome c oxidase subunit I [bacterium]
RMYSERWAAISAFLVFIGFNLTFFTQFVMGSHGMPRRYYNYIEKFTVYHQASTIGSYVLGLGFLIMIGYFAHSLMRGPLAPANPWGSATLEWETPSPPPPHNFYGEPVPGDPYAVYELRWDPETRAYFRQPEEGEVENETRAS